MCVVMIFCAITHTYHTLLAEAEKLLDLLRHEHLGTANCISYQLKNYGNSAHVVLENQESSLFILFSLILFDLPPRLTFLWQFVLLCLSLHVLAPALHPLHLCLQEA